MVKQAVDIATFLDTVSNEKLENWRTKEYCIVKNVKIGFRLDHQGMNKDGSGMHRLYIQPIKGGKTRNSKMNSSNVLAQVHVADPADPNNVRQALKDSYAQSGNLVVAKRKA